MMPAPMRLRLKKCMGLVAVESLSILRLPEGALECWAGRLEQAGGS